MGSANTLWLCLLVLTACGKDSTVAMHETSDSQHPAPAGGAASAGVAGEPAPSEDASAVSADRTDVSTTAGAAGGGKAATPIDGNANGSAGHSGQTSGSLAGSSAAAGGMSGSDDVGSGGESGATGEAGAAGETGAAGDTGAAGEPASGPGQAGTGGDAPDTSTNGYPMLTAAQLGTPKQILSGFRLAESPTWDPCQHRLLFADVQGGTGSRGVIHAVDADGKVSTFAANTGNTNGFAYQIDGSLILAQMSGHLAQRAADGTTTNLEPAGARLHTPDDVVVRSDGTIYFTDGDFCPIGNTLAFGAILPIFMLKPGATSLVQIGTAGGPNGIELSPDEKTLYVNGYGDGTVSAYDVNDDGTAKKRARALATGLGNPDSMCVDAAGNLYVGVDAGIQVLRPDGQKVKLIPIRSAAGSCLLAGVTNCGFGGDDGKTLYITTWTTVWQLDNMPIPGLDWLTSQQRAKCESSDSGM